ncbi:MAG: L-aspartate oxidase [Deltaproteobacteria bacterium]
MKRISDVLVIGSGIAGLSYALKVAEHAQVRLITKDKLPASATHYAQGGIAAVFDEEDSFSEHIEDTIAAGDGLCDPKIVKICVEEGPKRIQELIDYGIPFTKFPNIKEESKQKFHLTKEGGHSKRRVLHVQDATGASIQSVLIQRIKAHPNINICEDHMAIDLLKTPSRQCVGAYVLDQKHRNIITFLSKITVIATGGSGKVYLYTTNPDVATGDGVAMGHRAGIPIVNMEFFQFHPTCLYDPREKSFLITEAMRGEGGILRRKEGTAFMRHYHPKGELASRDIVARAIDHELKKTGDDCVFLDITHRDPKFIKSFFPTIYKKCLSLGIDITQQWIPVVPAAHYQCGGIATNDYGQTELSGLYAIGEAAYTGLHGANRLASNSLLEGIVFADRAAQKSLEELEKPAPLPEIPDWNLGDAKEPKELVVVSHLWDEIRHLMWNYVGIVRSNQRLESAKKRIDVIKQEIDRLYWESTLSKDLLELRNIAIVADIIIQSALSRKESRGLHYNVDSPFHQNPKAPLHSALTPRV